MELGKRCEKHGVLFESFKGAGGKDVMYCPTCEAEKEKETQDQAHKDELQRKQADINKRLTNAMIAPRFKSKTFDNFIIKYPRQQEIVNTARWFISNFDSSPGLITIGKPGTGKNHIASAIVHEVVEHKTAFCTEAIKIIREIKESWRKDGETESKVLKLFIEPELLVIDEIGVQFGTTTERMYLTEIINDRYNYLRPTIISGNVTIQELKQIVGERSVERFKEGGKVVVFDWESQRGRS
jgi:DNA replication protein DnaC